MAAFFKSDSWIVLGKVPLFPSHRVFIILKISYYSVSYIAEYYSYKQLINKLNCSVHVIGHMRSKSREESLPN